jgi:hypothetical protein
MTEAEHGKPMTLRDWRHWRRLTGTRINERLWLACPDPDDLLGEVGLGSERKLRLFCCACCRIVWHILVHQQSKAAVDSAERFADGLLTLDELGGVRAAASTVADAYNLPKQRDARRQVKYAEQRAAAATVSATRTDDGWPFWEHVTDVIHCIQDSAVCQLIGQSEESVSVMLADLLRDIFHNPFRNVILNPAWLAWNNSIVVKLAHQIYDDRHFDRMPVLANALEDAGCDDADILDHLRSPGPHVRGCFALDLLLGKE